MVHLDGVRSIYAAFEGNWWTFMLVSLLILTVQLYGILKEEI
jgi:hypothetical protein